jgi:hypothetical protein|tara:strand:+ start:3530 stop:4369 length:840 start_codon:yes stop_codon:yes gene_type:complete
MSKYIYSLVLNQFYKIMSIYMSVVDIDLYNEVKAEADEKYSKPSAYKSGWIVKTYKERGGTYKGKKPKKGVVEAIEEVEGGGLNAKKIQHMSQSSYKKNKDIQNIGRYKIDKSLSTSESKVFVNSDSGKVVIANRGTNPTVKDWTNNLSLLLGQYGSTQRYQNAKDTQKKALEKYPNYSFLNIGHSQSSAITKKLNDEGLTSEIININPAALPTDKKKDNETTIKSKGDIVSMYDKPKEGDVMIDSQSINPIAEHKTDIVNRLDPKTYIGSGFSFWVED